MYSSTSFGIIVLSLQDHKNFIHVIDSLIDRQTISLMQAGNCLVKAPSHVNHKTRRYSRDNNAQSAVKQITFKLVEMQAL